MGWRRGQPFSALGRRRGDKDLLRSDPLRRRNRVELFRLGGRGWDHVLRADGFTDLENKPGRKSGVLTTIPMAAAGATRVFLNADCRGGTIEAEILDPADGRPLPGYGRSDCLPVGKDSISAPVRWRSHSGLEKLPSEFQLRLTSRPVRTPPRPNSTPFNSDEENRPPPPLRSRRPFARRADRHRLPTAALCR